MTIKKKQHIDPEIGKTTGPQIPPFVRKMLNDIPEDLRDLFIPTTSSDLICMEARLVRFSQWEEERNKIRELQRRFGLPFRPNMTLREIAIRVRIERLRHDREHSYIEENYTDGDLGSFGNV